MVLTWKLALVKTNLRMSAAFVSSTALGVGSTFIFIVVKRKLTCRCSNANVVAVLKTPPQLTKGLKAGCLNNLTTGAMHLNEKERSCVKRADLVSIATVNPLSLVCGTVSLKDNTCRWVSMRRVH